MTQVLRYSAKMLTFVKEEMDWTRAEDCACCNYIKDIIFFLTAKILDLNIWPCKRKTGHFLLNYFLFFSELMELHFLRVGYRVADGKVEQSNMAKKKR